MSLRTFLENQKKVVFKKPVSTKYEAAALISRTDGNIAAFEKVKGHPGWRIVSGVCSSRDLVASALGVGKDEIIQKMSESLDNPIKCKVSKASYPKAVSEPNLLKEMPLMIYYQKMDRVYTSSCIFIVKDPDTGVQNASFHRTMFLKDNKMSVRIVPRHLYEIYNKACEKGKDLEVAVVNGVNPCVSIAGATSYSPDLDELEFANALMDGKLVLNELDGFRIPDAEIVLRGRLTPKKGEEGPFVDLTGTHDTVRQEPVLEVDKVYTKEDPIYQVILPGGQEHKILMGLPQEPRIFKIVQNTIPTVKNVVLSLGGCSWLHGVVQIAKRKEGDGKNTGLAALAAHPSMKRVVVVDPDVDPSSADEVEWAIATRVQPSKDVTIIKGATGSSLDKTQNPNKTTDKWIIDATIPLDKPKENFERAVVPLEDKINPKDYL